MPESVNFHFCRGKGSRTLHFQSARTYGRNGPAGTSEDEIVGEDIDEQRELVP